MANLSLNDKSELVESLETSTAVLRIMVQGEVVDFHTVEEDETKLVQIPCDCFPAGFAATLPPVYQGGHKIHYAAARETR